MGGGEEMKATKIAPVQVTHMIYKAAWAAEQTGIALGKTEAVPLQRYRDDAFRLIF